MYTVVLHSSVKSIIVGSKSDECAASDDSHVPDHSWYKHTVRAWCLHVQIFGCINLKVNDFRRHFIPNMYFAIKMFQSYT